MSMLQAYRDWRDAAALVKELEEATKGPQYGYEPPKVSPLYQEQPGDRWAGCALASRRYKQARAVEQAAREALFAALDALPEAT